MLLECGSFSKSSKSQSNASTIERYKSLDCSDTIIQVNANGLDDNVSESAPCSEPIDENPKERLSNNSGTKCDNIDKDKQFVDDVDGELKDCDLSDRRAGGYLIAVHRKLTRQDTYFLSYHKSRPSLFGVPLLIPCYEDGTNKDLYCAVWIQVARLLSPLPSTPPDQSNHATDWWVDILQWTEDLSELVNSEIICLLFIFVAVTTVWATNFHLSSVQSAMVDACAPSVPGRNSVEVAKFHAMIYRYLMETSHHQVSIISFSSRLIADNIVTTNCSATLIPVDIQFQPILIHQRQNYQCEIRHQGIQIICSRMELIPVP